MNLERLELRSAIEELLRMELHLVKRRHELDLRLKKLEREASGRES